jgi:hypothetical protein
MIPPQQQAPNPLIWLSASDAFVALSTQWPTKFMNQSPSVELDLIKTGEQLTGLSRSLTLKVSSEGKMIENYELFEKLASLYQKDLEAFSRILKNRSSSWLIRTYPDARFHPAITNNYSSEDEIGTTGAAVPARAQH